MRFVIIAAPRTGSSHLVNTLSGHPEIFCHGNVFAKNMMPTFWPRSERPPAKQAKEEKEALRKLRDEDPHKFLEQVFQKSHGRPNVGFKIFDGQNDSVLKKIISTPTVKKIILFRKNVLANYASAIAAAQSGQWSFEKNDAINPIIPKVTFNEKNFLKFHEKYIGYYQTVLDNLNEAKDVFWLCNYDEINDSQLLSGLVSFVGGDPQKAIYEDNQRKQQIKLNTTDIVSRFDNPIKVRKFLEMAGLLHWQYEGLMSLDHLNRGRGKQSSNLDAG